jgi:hypothetical protein
MAAVTGDAADTVSGDTPFSVEEARVFRDSGPNEVEEGAPAASITTNKDDCLDVTSSRQAMPAATDALEAPASPTSFKAPTVPTSESVGAASRGRTHPVEGDDNDKPFNIDDDLTTEDEEDLAPEEDNGEEEADTQSDADVDDCHDGLSLDVLQSLASSSPEELGMKYVSLKRGSFHAVVVKSSVPSGPVNTMLLSETLQMCSDNDNLKLLNMRGKGATVDPYAVFTPRLLLAGTNGGKNKNTQLLSAILAHSTKQSFAMSMNQYAVDSTRPIVEFGIENDDQHTLAVRLGSGVHKDTDLSPPTNDPDFRFYIRIIVKVLHKASFVPGRNGEIIYIIDGADTVVVYLARYDSAFNGAGKENMFHFTCCGVQDEPQATSLLFDAAVRKGEDVSKKVHDFVEKLLHLMKKATSNYIAPEPLSTPQRRCTALKALLKRRWASSANRVNGTNDGRQWMRTFLEVKGLFVANGSKRVLPADIADETVRMRISRWFCTQRSQRKLLLQNKESKMTEDKLQLLNSIDMDWNEPSQYSPNDAFVGFHGTQPTHQGQKLYMKTLATFDVGSKANAEQVVQTIERNAGVCRLKNPATGVWEEVSSSNPQVLGKIARAIRDQRAGKAANAEEDFPPSSKDALVGACHWVPTHLGQKFYYKTVATFDGAGTKENAEKVVRAVESNGGVCRLKNAAGKWEKASSLNPELLVKIARAIRHSKNNRKRQRSAKAKEAPPSSYGQKDALVGLRSGRASHEGQKLYYKMIAKFDGVSTKANVEQVVKAVESNGGACRLMNVAGKWEKASSSNPQLLVKIGGAIRNSKSEKKRAANAGKASPESFGQNDALVGFCNGGQPSHEGQKLYFKILAKFDGVGTKANAEQVVEAIERNGGVCRLKNPATGVWEEASSSNPELLDKIKQAIRNSEKRAANRRPKAV